MVAVIVELSIHISSHPDFCFPAALFPPHALLRGPFCASLPKMMHDIPSVLSAPLKAESISAPVIMGRAGPGGSMPFSCLLLRRLSLSLFVFASCQKMRAAVPNNYHKVAEGSNG